jgi:hypothetical protein
MVEMRVLVAHEDEHRAYREAIAASIGLLRPHVEVATCSPDELGAELVRFDPQVVICGAPGRPDPGHTPAWVELPDGPWQPARIRVGDGRRERVDLDLVGLLGVVEEAEKFLRAQADRAGFRGPLGRGKGNRPSS